MIQQFLRFPKNANKEFRYFAKSYQIWVPKADEEDRVFRTGFYKRCQNELGGDTSFLDDDVFSDTQPRQSIPLDDASPVSALLSASLEPH